MMPRKSNNASHVLPRQMPVQRAFFSYVHLCTLRQFGKSQICLIFSNGTERISIQPPVSSHNSFLPSAAREEHLHTDVSGQPERGEHDQASQNPADHFCIQLFCVGGVSCTADYVFPFWNQSKATDNLVSPPTNLTATYFQTSQNASYGRKTRLRGLLSRVAAAFGRLSAISAVMNGLAMLSQPSCRKSSLAAECETSKYVRVKRRAF